MLCLYSGSPSALSAGDFLWGKAMMTKKEKHAAQMRRWRAKNPEKDKEYSKRYYAENRDRYIEMGKAWRAANPEKRRETWRKWYAANPDCSKKWRAENPEKVKAIREKWNTKNPDYFKKRLEANRERINKKRREDYAANPEKRNEEINRWKAANPEKVRAIARKRKANRRNLGYVALNKPFDGCQPHHIDKERVIHIPAELHTSVWHSVIKDIRMEEINRLAFQFLESQTREAQ